MSKYNIIKKLDVAIGTPFYITYPDRYFQNIDSFTKAFTSRYDKFILAYSFKTNYTPPILTIARDYGCYAEVVSEMEYGMAISLGYDKRNIVCNGPVKRREWLRSAIENGSVINLDGEYEADAVIAMIYDLPKPVKVGLRINMEINTAAGASAIQSGLKESRFGMSEEVLHRVIPRLKSAGVLINSLHGHTSSTNRAVENYQLIAERFLQICNNYHLDDVEYLDFGGSYFGGAPKEISIVGKPTFDDYAEGILNTLKADKWFEIHKPFIVIEPGTSVVTNTLELVTKVYQHKCIRGKHFVVVDGSIFQVKSQIGKINYPFEEVSNNEIQEPIQCDIVGSTCMEVDKISVDVQLSHYRHGDYLVYKSVGAYRNNMTPFFINARPPIVTINENGEWSLVRPRQEVGEMIDLLKY